VASRGRLRPFQRVLYSGGELGVRGLDHRGLGNGAVLSGWRNELRAWVGSARSGVYRCGQGRAFFRAQARLVELVLDALVGFGSKGVVLGEGGMVPCWNGRGMHGSVLFALGWERWARSGRSQLAGNRAKARGQGGARDHFVVAGYWVVEWRGRRAHWRGWAARRAA
jgi:hypothetical protein